MLNIRRIAADTNFNIAEINKLLDELSPGRKHDQNDSELIEALTNPFFHMLVAIDGKEGGCEIYAGMASIFFQKNLAKWIAEIHDVVVSSEYRGQGTGETLMKKLLEIAAAFSKQNGAFVELSLTSHPSRAAANRLYAKLGFALAAEACGSWGTNLYKIIVGPDGCLKGP